MGRQTAIHEGMVVYSGDRHHLGKVIWVGDREFQIEKGVVFPRDFLASLDDVEAVEGRSVYLRHDKEALLNAPPLHLDAAETGPARSGPSALGPQGRARMDRVHDVIGAWSPTEPGTGGPGRAADAEHEPGREPHSPAIPPAGLPRRP